MPYASEVRVGADTGAPLSINGSLTLWELFTTLDNENRFRQEQVDQEVVPFSANSSTKTPFSFVAGPSFLSNRNHSIALAGYEAGSPGPLFRSGKFDTLPPGSPGDVNGLVDVMLIAQQRSTMAMVNASIPTPITLSDGTVISTAVISSAPPSRNLTLVATGPYGRGTFTYTLVFTIDPSDDQIDLTSALVANAVGSGTISVTPGPGGGLQAFIDNLFSYFFIGKINTQVIATITTKVNAAAIAAAASAAAAVGVSALPAGVVLGVRSVGVASNGDLLISPALGSLGPIIEKFVAAAPPPSSSGSTCFIATAVHGASSIEVATLRAFRDEHLVLSTVGSLLIRCYEKLSPPLAALIRRSSILRALARIVLVFPLYKLAIRVRKREV